MRQFVKLAPKIGERALGGRQEFDFKGRSAIVTGGTRGLGRAVVARLADAGCRVATCGRNAPADLPDGVSFHQVDVRDPEAAAAFVDAVAADQGGLDILVNNAGGSPASPAEAGSPRFHEAILRLNLLAPLTLSQAAFRHMAGKGGSIVNIASVSAQRPSPGTAVYGAAKAGLVSLTQSLAQEWGGQGVRVNAIIAGLMATETTEATYGSEASQARIAGSIPLGRFGDGDDIAGAVLWLSSDGARWVSGARLNVDGGGERPLFLELLKGN
jgi:NAD(P)-dependent dehydrogenase (short-subunit alcohol dehydrogenase family)